MPQIHDAPMVTAHVTSPSLLALGRSPPHIHCDVRWQHLCAGLVACGIASSEQRLQAMTALFTYFFLFFK
jgi:hypothetical protein